MSASTHKKVLLRRLQPMLGPLGLTPVDRGIQPGFIDPSQLTGSGTLELLTPAGKAQTIAWNDVQSVFFVVDFDQVATVLAMFPGPRRGTRGGRSERTPIRQEGLLVRVRFRDRQTLEAVLENELFPMPAGGYSLFPVRGDSACQRIFVPHTAVAQITVLDVLRPARLRRPSPRPAREKPLQFPLFSGEREEEI